MAEMKARITLDSNGYTAGVNKVVSDTDNMINATKRAKENMEQLGKTKIQPKIGADTNEAEKNISKMRESINGIKKNVSFMIQAKDSASASISRIKANAETLTKSTFRLEIAALDKTKSVISGIKDSIFSLKTLAAGIVLGAGAKQGFDLTLGNAMSNEKYLSTLQTVTHSDKAGSEALKWSYQQAAATPFDAKEVVAGVTQLATSGLDFKKYLMPLGDTAAAMNKPLEQAMAAMSKLKSGQNGIAVDMFRDLGISNTDWTKAGATFNKQGELMQKDPQKNVDMVTKIMQSKYGGLMERQSGTAGGMISNIGDTVNGMGRGLAGIDGNGAIMKGGLFDNFKQQLTVIMPLLNKIQGSNAFKDLQKDISNLATAGGQKLTTFLKGFEDPKQIKQYKNEFNQFIKDVKAGWEVAKEFGKAIGTIMTALTPLIKTVAAHPKLFLGLFAGFESIKGISTITKTLRDINKEFPILGKTIKLFAKWALEDLGLISKFFIANPWVLAIGLVVLAVVGLYEAWKTNFGGCRTYINEVINDVELAWDGLKKFFSNPIKGVVNIAKSYDKENSMGTVSVPVGAFKIPIPIPKKKNALGTNYFEGGSTWINENGPEIVTLPSGSKISSNRESMNMLNASKNSQPNLVSMTNSAKSVAPQAESWGKDIPNNLAKGITNNTKIVTDSVTFMATKIRELIHFSTPDKGPLSDFDTYSVDMLKNFGAGVKNNTKLVVDPTNNMSSDVKNVYSALSTESNTYGQQAIQQFGAGVQSSTDNLVGIVKTLTDKVIETFKSGFGIHSPSVVMYTMGGHLMQGLMNGMTSKDMGGFVQNWIGSMTSTMGGAVSGNLSGWISTAMALTGVSSDWFGPLATLIDHESGGDPNNINTYDINAQEGHPSKGLMQLIDENMSENHLPGMTNIFDPISNIAAGIRLIQHDYGSIFNTPGIKALARGGSYVGYANGGIADQASIFGEGQYAEAAIPLKKNSSRSQQLLDIASNYINGDKKSSKSDGQTFIIQKLADQIIVREDADIDKIATALAKKLKMAAMNS